MPDDQKKFLESAKEAVAKEYNLTIEELLIPAIPAMRKHFMPFKVLLYFLYEYYNTQRGPAPLRYFENELNLSRGQAMSNTWTFIRKESKIDIQLAQHLRNIKLQIQ